MKFFTYHQNNSGGSYESPARFVIIEARNAHLANAIAEDNGLYFDGCRSGKDCSCCGDRWYRCDDLDGTDAPEIYGETNMNTVVSDPFYNTGDILTILVIRWNGDTEQYPAL